MNPLSFRNFFKQPMKGTRLDRNPHLSTHLNAPCKLCVFSADVVCETATDTGHVVFLSLYLFIYGLLCVAVFHRDPKEILAFLVSQGLLDSLDKKATG